jgi:hypothetical protein
VIPRAGAEYRQVYTKFIQIYKPLNRYFFASIVDDLYGISSIKYRDLYASYLLLISASVGVTAARIPGTRLGSEAVTKYPRR